MVTLSLLPPRYARYSRLVLSSILVQSMINAAGGHILARAYVLPHVGDVFRACAVLTQLAINEGDRLFEVEYGDNF